MKKYFKSVALLLVVTALLMGCNPTSILKRQADRFTPKPHKAYLFVYGYMKGCNTGAMKVFFKRENSGRRYLFRMWESEDANKRRYGPNFPREVVPGTYYLHSMTNYIGLRGSRRKSFRFSRDLPVFRTRIKVEAGKLYYLGNYMATCSHVDLYTKRIVFGHIRDNHGHDLAEMHRKMPNFRSIPVVNVYKHLTGKDGYILKLQQR